MFNMRNVTQLVGPAGAITYKFGKVPLQEEGLIHRVENFNRKNEIAGWELDEHPSYLAAQLVRIRHSISFEDRAAAMILAAESRLTYDFATGMGFEICYLTEAGADAVRALSRVLADPTLDPRLRAIAEEAKHIIIRSTV